MMASTSRRLGEFVETVWQEPIVQKCCGTRTQVHGKAVRLTQPLNGRGKQGQEVAPQNDFQQAKFTAAPSTPRPAAPRGPQVMLPLRSSRRSTASTPPPCATACE